MLIRVADYVANTLVRHGIRHVFLISGGGAMHLNDAIGKHPKLQYVCNHHEQASAMAAESYARLTGKLAAINVTSGPGGTNAITGVLGGWLDSIPMLIISGQVRYDTTVRSTGLKLRQLGDQEYDIIKSIEPMTKYSVMVTDPKDIRYHLEKAIYLALIGRPGPCWIDIPLNIQAAMVEEGSLQGFDVLTEHIETIPVPERQTIIDIIDKIKKAERPVLFAGSAIRGSGCHEAFLTLIDLLKIPVVTAWNAHDCLYDAHSLYIGRPGTVGDRAGNFAVQNADLLLVFGSRLNVRQIGYNWNAFAREAYKIVVDIDPLELNKPTLSVDYPIRANVADIVQGLVDYLHIFGGLESKHDWVKWCRDRRDKYPVVLPEYWNRESLVNPYCFTDSLSRHLDEGQITVCANGSACVCAFQAFYLKPKQRLYTNSGCAAMGYDLPGAIGACFGSNKAKIVCIAGDGSIQMNLQELQTIIHYNLPIKIFVLNNRGYHSIRQTQSNFFGEPLVAADASSGVSFPDMGKIAAAYGIVFNRCYNHKEMEHSINATLDCEGPAICEVMITIDQPFAPKSASKRLPDGRMVSKPLEELAPFLRREEVSLNMLISMLPEE